MRKDGYSSPLNCLLASLGLIFATGYLTAGILIQDYDKLIKERMAQQIYEVKWRAIPNSPKDSITEGVYYLKFGDIPGKDSTKELLRNSEEISFIIKKVENE